MPQAFAPLRHWGILSGERILSMRPADRQLLRHTLATLSYRCGKTLRDAPDSFADFAGGTRTPAKILAHIGDLMDWALSMAIGKQVWRDSPPLPWKQECQRFFAALRKFDDLLSSDAELAVPLEGLFQGPIADALTHTAIPSCSPSRSSPAIRHPWKRHSCSPCAAGSPRRGRSGSRRHSKGRPRRSYRGWSFRYRAR